MIKTAIKDHLDIINLLLDDQEKNIQKFSELSWNTIKNNGKIDDEENLNLYLERIKEELKVEKSTIHAFDTGYKKAQSAVLDANITTLISAAILFFMGSGPVKGFAVTLGIGILTTLFSAYFFARHLSSSYAMKNKDRKILL